MSSSEYRKLVDAVDELRAHLMDFEASPVEPYTKGQLLKCQAFVVFSHAEMQVYWEAVSRRILSEAETKWKTTSEINRVIGTLVAFRRPEQVSVPTDPSQPHDKGNFSWLVREALKAQTEVIAGNNGIKRANISELLVPLGVLPSDFVEAMLIQLDQAGKKRGEMVHKSSRVSLQNIRDPISDEMKGVDDLILEIGSFDSKLEEMGLLSV